MQMLITHDVQLISVIIRIVSDLPEAATLFFFSFDSPDVFDVNGLL